MRYEFFGFDDPDEEGYRFSFQAIDDMGPIAERQEVLDWCVERFGSKPLESDGARWYPSAKLLAFWFRDEMDAFDFRLRWC